MATYVNDLRLKEIGTGESSGTWGTETNVNLELIGEALGYGTEGITTNADTHTTTVADGSTDPGRAMYIEYTGTLDSACTITIAPNTLSRLHYIENGTSGSQNIIIKQGSGATVTIPPGDTKAVYLDGAGSGAKVVDVFASFSVVDLKVQDDLTVTDDVAIGGLATVGGTLGVTGILTCTDDIIIGDGKTIGSASDVDSMTIAANGQVTFTQTLIGTALDISGDIDVDGTANLDIVDIDGAVDMASTLQVDGVATFTGRDIHSGGITIANAGQIGSVGDTDAIAIASDGVVTLTQKLIGTELDISGNVDVDGTTNLDVVDIDGAVDMATTLNVTGVATLGTGMNVTGTGITGMNISAGTSHVAFIDFGDSGDTNFGGINYNNADDTLNLRAGNANRFTINSSGNSSFTGTVTANAGVVVDNITIDGTQIDLSSGDLTLDVAGKILLSADDAGTIQLFDGSLHYGSITEDNSNLIVQSIVQDEDILFRGDDGGTVITALTLDMSSAGAATFNGTVTANVARTSSSSAVVLTLKDNVTGGQTDGVYKALRSESNGTSSVSEIRFIESDGTNNNTAIGFATAASAGAISEKMRIHPGGVVSFLSGIELGSGLDASASNTLDDYEEGTWTPATGPGSSQGYVFRSGNYTKVGRLVTAYFGLKHNAGSFTSGEAVITGLPFAVQATGSFQEPMIIVTTLGNLPTGAGGSGESGAFIPGEVAFYLAGGESQGRGRKFTTNADANLLADTVFDSDSFIKGTVVYYTS